MKKLEIEVYSDVICPWCYLGKHRLEQALASFEKPPEVEIHYLPYELNPATPPEGHDRKEYLKARYGSALRSADERLRTLGQEVGIDFHFDKAGRIPNTFLAHRLVWLAGKEGLEERMVEALHRAYFTEGRDVGNADVLAQVAGENGMDIPKVRKFLSSNDGSEEVRALEEKAYNLGIGGVPFFVFNGKTAIEGAQPLSVFTDAIRELAEDL